MRRTQAAGLVAWAASAGALAAALYPALAAALFAFLVGLVMVMTMRTSLRGGLAVGLAAAAPFVFAEVTLGAAAPGQRGDLASLALGLALLVASALVADTASGTDGAAAAEDVLRDEGPSWSERATVVRRDAGLRRAEWELARACEYRREVAFALVGVDGPAGEDAAADQVAAMALLDELVAESVTGFDLVCEYGPRERLMVLPEESAATLRDCAAQLCAVATERLGRRVRMSLASFPAHGTTVRALLAELELDLATCRTHGASVQVCAIPAGPLAPTPEPVAEPERAPQPVLDDSPTRQLVILEAPVRARPGGGTVMSA